MTYSFLNTTAVIAGPGGKVDLGAGAAVAEEGITIEPVEEKNQMTIGADGQVQHSLIANNAAKITVRLLKTSPANAKLGLMFDAQSASAALWGINVMSVNNSSSGDVSICQQVAFNKKPVISYQKEGGFMEWVFDAGVVNTVFGIL